MNHRCDYHREGSPAPDHCRSCGHPHAAHLDATFGGGCRPDGHGTTAWGFPVMVECRCRGWAVA